MSALSCLVAATLRLVDVRSSAGASYTADLVLGEVLAGSDQRLCRVAALRNCLVGGSPVRLPRDSAWAPRVEWSVAH